MSDIRVAIDNPDSPTWLPPPSTIIARCREVGLIVQGFVEHSPDGSESVWIKQGILIAMGEARTQKFLADVVNSDENCVVRVPQVYRAFRDEERGYIVMEYIPGHDCTDDDLDAVVEAVRRFRTIESPTTSPGYVGGGPILHQLFSELHSVVEYPSIADLQHHVNRVCPYPFELRLSHIDFNYLPDSCCL